MKTALTIAGSDSSGGAGIQADIKTMSAHKVYAMSVITAITAQNTMGVTAVEDISAAMVAKQLDAVFSDIVPDSVKIGMVSSSEIIEVIADKLAQYDAKNVVLDTVMLSTSGHKLISDNAIQDLITKLMPQSHIITPNLAEAEVLCGHAITSKEQMVAAAKQISTSYQGYILIKGGHLEGEHQSSDLLYKDGHATWFTSPRIDNTNTHGTGCTLSSAIASNLAMGHSMETAVNNAKAYITGAIQSKLALGHGRGPIDHTHHFTLKG